ncbi:MAG: ferritin family protein [Armatimonadota bacterium]
MLGGVQATAENLQAAIDGEGSEFRDMYPKMVAEAEAEGNTPATFSFKHALAVEEIHHGLYSGALEAVQAGNDLPAARMFVCGVCGNTVNDEAPGTCPVCGAAKDQFFEVE